MPAKKGGARAKSVSNSAKAGLFFPVGRMGRMLKKGLYSRRVGLSAAVYVASALESIIEDIVECAAGQADI